MNKTIREIMQNDYIIPLYQRNFTWEELQIHQLIQDVYNSFQNHINNYFLGSLVTLKRNDGYYEVIDGQQRLTFITLIAKILQFEDITSPCLKYDSRYEVKKFLMIIMLKKNKDIIPKIHLR
jgi:uncharacterized protein with ParB-like and HNH nuclease domain